MKHFVVGLYSAAIIVACDLHPGVTTSPADGRIDRVASLATPRSVHTATALASGQLLVTGGMRAGGGSLASAELVDLSGGTVRTVTPMAETRASHTAIALPDGRVVLAGGFNGNYLSSVEVFDPVRQRFESIGQLSEGRSEHTATLMPDGRILIIGGVGRGWTFLSSAELYDPASGRSELVGSMSVGRESHTATVLPDGRVLVVGGHQGRRESMEVFASSEIYDPATRRFQPAGTMATARHKHDAVLLADGRVLVLGGADRTDRLYYATTEIFTPATASFTPGPTMRSSRYKIRGTTVLLSNGDVLVPSGAREAELLDRQSFAFRAVAGDFPAAYAFATATRVATGAVAIVGGYDARIQNTEGVWLFRER